MAAGRRRAAPAAARSKPQAREPEPARSTSGVIQTQQIAAIPAPPSR